MQLSTLLTLLACSRSTPDISTSRPTAPAPEPTSSSPPPSSDTSESTATADTSDEASTPTAYHLPPPSDGALSPTVRLIPGGDLEIFALPSVFAAPGVPPTLEVPISKPGGLPHALLDPLSSRGDISVDQLWDGITAAGYGRSSHPVADTNGDGIYDYWFLSKLLKGPIEGKNAEEAFHTETPIAMLSPPGSPDSPFAEVALAGFDANGDGHSDILVDFGGGNMRQVYFGPFAGNIAEIPEDQGTFLGTTDSDECRDPPLLLRDVRGPGLHSLLIGGQDWPRWCSPDWFLVDLEAEPVYSFSGTQGTMDMPAGYLQAIPDLDGDGRAEVFASHTQQISGFWPDPRDGHYTIEDFELPFEVTASTRAYLQGTIGDVNADGIPDFIGYTNPSDPYTVDIYPEPKTYVLLSPHADPLVVDQGVQIEPVSTHAFQGPLWVYADFDQDGHDDLAYGMNVDTFDPDYDRVVFVYSGADLTAADPRATGATP